MSDWQALGGEAGVRGHVDAYVRRFADDFVIGFLFAGKDLPAIVEHELALASMHLGGELRYQGRGLKASHAPLRINAGHFRRRLAIVRHVLGQRGVESGIVERWIAYEQRLQAVITDGTDCGPETGQDA